ncbi:hypothetical protein SLA2020_411120 [Shorea laevis]
MQGLYSSLRIFYRTPLANSLCTCVPCSKLFVDGLSFDTNETVLRDAFQKYGEIIEVKVICHHVTGKSRGYGFVRFASEVTARAAQKEMNGQVLDGKTIFVEYAHHQG